MSTKIFEEELDAEEQDILNSIERGEWKTITNVQNHVDLARTAASCYLQKDARVNIRLSSNDLRKLKQRAAYKGLPYQTLIASVLHEYAAGHFEEKL